MNWEDYILPRSFYHKDATSLAKDLLGKFIVRNFKGKILVGMITETEAYLPVGDLAAHGHKGKTNSNKSLYKEAGHTYIHNMHRYSLLDIVADGIDVPGSVLIRAILPLEGIEVMQNLREVNNIKNLTNGPGKICKALSITRELDGIDITNEDNNLFISYGKEAVVEHKIISSERIGISKSKEMLLRFCISEN